MRADVPVALATASEAFGKARVLMRAVREEIEAREGMTKCKATRAKDKLRAMETGLDDEVLAFFSNLGSGNPDSTALERIANTASKTRRMSSDYARRDSLSFAQGCLHG